MTATRPGLEVAGDGELAGRDPRRMMRGELEALGHDKRPLRRAIRDRCLDCCADQPSEVRACVSTKCALWPYRMGSDPFRAPADEAKRERARQMAAGRSKTITASFSARELDAAAAEGRG